MMNDFPIRIEFIRGFMRGFLLFTKIEGLMKIVKIIERGIFIRFDPLKDISIIELCIILRNTRLF